MKICIASGNVHKLREFKQLLKLCRKSLEVYTLRDFPAYEALPEDKDTFLGNASQKAEHAAKTLGMLCIADDSGLVVPALRGEPGVRSARFAGERASDLENRTLLLSRMQGLNGFQRQAFFECSLAIASPQGLLKTFKGICEGEILPQAAGVAGFGYDPLFVKHDYKKSFAELTEDQKNAISHRRKAMDMANLFLERVNY